VNVATALWRHSHLPRQQPGFKAERESDQYGEADRHFDIHLGADAHQYIDSAQNRKQALDASLMGQETGGTVPCLGALRGQAAVDRPAALRQQAAAQRIPEGASADL
jgi:hypothetical protein